MNIPRNKATQWLSLVIVIALLALSLTLINPSIVQAASSDIIITEIMYNPASDEDNWEWVEIYNTGASPVDLSGWVVDDGNSVAQTSANIASGSVAPTSSAILYNADDISAADFEAAWGTGINLIAVTNWNAMALNNTGDRLGLWDSFASYDNDNVVHANAIITILFDDSGAWPSDDGFGSIYLTSLGADASDGANWALSSDGVVTPVNAAYTSQAAGGNGGADIGSPGGSAPAPTFNLLITEIIVTPTGSEFVEIYNPGTEAVDLSDVYLTDATFAGGGTYYYNIVTGSNAGGGGFGDFHARFPDGASIAAGEYQTVSMAGSDDFFAAFGINPTYELFEDGLSADAIPDMREALPGSINGQGGLTNDGEVVILYAWDGASDLVADLDYVVWGDKVEGVSKTGVIIDGIDADLNTSSYANDTAIGSQNSVSSSTPHASGESLQRADLDEGTETKTGGNGLTGHDETSENLSETFCSFAPTPNAANTCPAPPEPSGLVINEINADPDTVLGDANGDGVSHFGNDEFVEIVNVSGASINLSGWTLSDGFGVRHTFPIGTILPDQCAIVIFGGGTPTGSFGGALVQTASSGTLGLNNGGDSVTLNDGSADVVSAGYGGAGGDNQSLTLDPDITGTDYVKHSVATGSGGALFSPGTSIDGSSFGADCVRAVTPIHVVQGDGASTPLNGSVVTIQGIVVGDFQDDLGASGDLNGFYVQEQVDDGNDSTSEGIFVFEGNNPTVDIVAGDLVQVTGIAGENFGETQVSASEIFILSSANALPSPTIVSLPLDDLVEWEYVEGMLVTVQGESGDLTVNDTFDLGRFGSFQLSSGGRVYTYSQLYTPTDVDSFNVYHEASRLRTIVVDDGLTSQNPNPTPLINGAPFSAANTVRSGYTTSGVTGIINYSFSEYRLHPTAPVNLTTASNERTAPAPLFGGTLRVASVNLLNYFNGDGQGGGFPTARGANNFDEYQRQHAKTIAALIGLDADIIAVIELENDYGDGADSAAQSLVDGLNSVANTCLSDWAYVDPGVSQVGDDAIAVGFLYCTDTVSIAANTSPAILDDSQLVGLGLDTLAPVFNGPNTNRASLAVTFYDKANDSNITVVVNHFKSKGAGGATGANVDSGNGAGAYNQRRQDAVTVLHAWLATKPTGTSDNDVLIVGDLNAYSMEDPILDLLGLGYSNLVDDADAYSYGFPLILGAVPEVQGWGTLDYAMANSSTALQVVDAAEWHINSDEPGYIDYNTEFKPSALLDELYDPDAYRASDHDPLVIGLNLNRPPTAVLALIYPSPFLLGETVNLVFTDVNDEGGILTYEIDCADDGTFELSSNSTSFACDYADAGNYTIRGRITDSFGDYNEYTINIDVLTVDGGIDYLASVINSYESDGLLNGGQANSLLTKLDNLSRSLERDNLNSAVAQIQGIMSQIQDFIADGVLSSEDGNTLYYFAQNLLYAIVSGS